MADILGKDLDLWENSTATESPFNLKAEDVQLSKYISGGDLLKSLKINQNMKVPVELKALSYDPTTPKFVQPFISMGRKAVDAIVDAPDTLKNLAAQIAVERLSGDKAEKSAKDKIIDSLLGGTEIGELNRIAAEGLGTVMTLRTMKDTAEDIKDKAKTYDEAIDLLNDREYPIAKYARRVLAETTDNVETRRVVHELYNQAQGIDSSKWYNQAGAIIGAMLPDLVLTRGVYKGARLLGAGRANAVRAATNIMTGVVGVEEAGRYAEETAAQYIERTGDKTFENFTAKDATGLSAMAYGAISGRIEFMGGVEPIVAGAITKVGLRSSLGKAFTKSALQEGAEELGQGIAELLTRKIDGTSDKTWKQGFEEALTGAVWGALIGGPIGTAAFYANRRNLVKGIKSAIPNINDTQAQQIADAMIDSTAEMSTQDPTLRGSLRQKVELMYRDSDIENKEDIIDATTDLEYGLIAMDSAERGIDLADNPLFNGEVNELGWFREGIPTERRAEIQEINDNIVDLKNQLAELNKAQEKDWTKIEEIENKLAQANQYVLDKLSELVRDDSASVRRMFEELEGRYVAKEKERALDSFEATTEQKELAKETANLVLDTLANEGIEAQIVGGQNKQRAHGSSYLLIKRPGATDIKIRFGVTPIGTRHSAVVANFNVEKMSQEEILNKIRELIDQKFVKSNKATNVNIGFDEEPMFQEEPYSGDTIVVDGVERTVYNSNGDKIADSAEALTNFWRWFGDSKVVDEQGRPLVVYHQTSEKFDTFMRGKDKAGKFDYETPGGFFFKSSDKNIGIAGNIQMPVYLKAEKTITFDNRQQLQKYWSENIDGYADLLKQYQNVDKDYSAKVDNIDAEIDKAIDDLENSESYKNATDEQQYQMRSDLMDSFDSTELFDEWKNAGNRIAEQMKSLVNDYVSANNIEMVKLENDSGAIGKKTTDSFIVFESTQIKSVDNRGTYSSDTGNIYWQNRVSGGAPATYRGAYIPEYRFILRANRMDASTLSHELAHDWFEVNFNRYRSGKATKDFMRAWGALEKALGVPENAMRAPRQASETFARAYEAWVTSNEDWSKFISVEDKDKDKVEKLLKDYQGELRDIYNDINNKYFKNTWGKLGELKPELKAWFDRVVNITDLDTLVERGEITEEEASTEKLNRAIDTVIENTADEESVNALKVVRTLNDTKRYEAEGGNKNSLQRRLSVLAREIDENNMVVKGEKYDTRRDMLAVAQAADNFVKTRLDDALAIINGQMAEVEGLYKEDLYTALERLAVENGDLGLIDELKNSEVANRLAKELGQRVAGFRNFKQSTDLDVVSALKSLDNKFNEALKNKKAQKEFDSALKLLDDSIKQQDKIADKELDNFLTELECK